MQYITPAFALFGFLVGPFVVTANCQTFTKGGIGAIECADRIDFTIQLFDHYTVTGDDALTLKTILKKYLASEWWVTSLKSSEQSFPVMTFSFYHKAKDREVLILRTPITKDNLIDINKSKNLVQDLNRFVAYHKLKSTKISNDPNESLKTEEMTLDHKKQK